MTKSYFPFDSGPGASISEAQWTKMSKNWLRTGVIEGLKVYADSTGLKVKVPAGKAWMEGHFFESDTVEELSINYLSSNSRIDRVILRLDWTANTINLAVLQGLPAVSPMPPAITQNYSRWEIPLAQIKIVAGAMTVAAGDVTDERPLAGNVNIQQPKYTNATLINGWSNYVGSNYPAQYMKDEMGFVHIRGRVSATASGTVIFTLPSGYRPSSVVRGGALGDWTEPMFSRYEIHPDGKVYGFITGSDISSFCLDDIKDFMAEQ